MWNIIYLVGNECEYEIPPSPGTLKHSERQSKRQWKEKHIVLYPSVLAMYTVCQTCQDMRVCKLNTSHSVMFLSELMLICARSQWLSSLIFSYNETCNHARWIIFNEVETKDLCTVRYSSTSNKRLLFCLLFHQRICKGVFQICTCVCGMLGDRQVGGVHAGHILNFIVDMFYIRLFCALCTGA
jgi:hypothetical protein